MHHCDPAFIEAREKLRAAVEEYSRATEDSPHIILGATVVFETSIFDDEGDQLYDVKHVILPPSSLAHAVGLLDAARDRLKNYINTPDKDD